MSIRTLCCAGLSALVMLMEVACDSGPSVPVGRRRVIPMGHEQPGTMASQRPVPIMPETAGSAAGRTQ